MMSLGAWVCELTWEWDLRVARSMDVPIKLLWGSVVARKCFCGGYIREPRRYRLGAL